MALFDKENLSSIFNAEILDKVEKVCQELDAVIHQIVPKLLNWNKCAKADTYKPAAAAMIQKA